MTFCSQLLEIEILITLLRSALSGSKLTVEVVSLMKAMKSEGNLVTQREDLGAKEHGGLGPRLLILEL